MRGHPNAYAQPDAEVLSWTVTGPAMSLGSHTAEAAWREREEMAEDLRTAWSEGDIDPLLSTLTALRNRRLQAWRRT